MRKILFCIVLICLFISCQNVFAEEDKFNKDIYVGMSLGDFFKIMPKKEMDAYGQYIFKQKIGKLDGKWVYDFKDKKLDWFVYSYYPEEVDKKTYDFLLRETKFLIKELTNVYGKPQNVSKTQSYKGLKHYGYEVKGALWSTPKMNIKLEFYFFGGKGEYFMFVKVEYQPPEYKF